MEDRSGLFEAVPHYPDHQHVATVRPTLFVGSNMLSSRLQPSIVKQYQKRSHHRVRQDLDMCSSAFTPGGARGRESQSSFHVVFDLLDHKLLYFQFGNYATLSDTLVTAVPARKNTTSRAKKMLQGCMAWTTAVKAATTMPKGVRDFLEYARYTRPRVAGTAMKGCIGPLRAWELSTR